MSEYSPYLNALYRGVVFIEGIIGVRIHAAQAIVLRGNDVLLVRTRYRPYWEFPGGKSERYEAPEVTAVRETKEEASVFIKEIDRKLGTYQNPQMRRRATIHVFIAREWEELDLWGPSLEIAERGFFPLDRLPEDTSTGTKNRLSELALKPEKELIGMWV